SSWPQGTRAKSGKDIAAVGAVEVAPGIAEQPAAGRPAAAAQHFVVAEPRRRVFLVWGGFEAGGGQEIVRSPFPHIADCQPAAARAVRRRMSGHIDAAQGPRVQVSPVSSGLVIAPGEAPLARSVG